MSSLADDLAAAKALRDAVRRNPPPLRPVSVCLRGLQHRDLYAGGHDTRLVYASVYTTHLCQLHCLYCSKHFEMIDVEAGRVEPLTQDETLRFIRDAHGQGLRTLIFQGMAEPTLDRSLRAYVELAASLGITSVLFTNLLACGDDLTRLLYEHDVSIVPSVDTLRRDPFHLLTSSKLFDQFEKALATLKRVYGPGSSGHADPQLPRVLLSTVLTRHNMGDLDAIRQLVNEMGWLLCVKVFGVKGAAKPNFDLLAGDTELYGVLRELAECYADKSMVTETVEGKCACGGRGGLLVDLDGKIGACGDSLTRVDANIRTHSIAECLEAKRRFVCSLPDYNCLSKSLRGFGDVHPRASLQRPASSRSDG